MTRRLIFIPLTLLVVPLASCSSSHSTAPEGTRTTIASPPAKPSSSECATASTSLTQINQAILAIGLGSTEAKGGSPSSTSSTSLKAAQIAISDLSNVLQRVAPGIDVRVWKHATLSYAAGLARAAQSGSSQQVNTFNSKFLNSETGIQMSRQLAGINAALAKSCS